MSCMNFFLMFIYKWELKEHYRIQEIIVVSTHAIFIVKCFIPDSKIQLSRTCQIVKKSLLGPSDKEVRQTFDNSSVKPPS